MKTLLKTTTILFLFFFVAKNTAIEPISEKNSRNISQENEDVFIFDEDDKSKIEKGINFSNNPNNPVKYAAALAIAFGAHYVLEFMSTYAHEHGHGIASQSKYTVKMIPTGIIAAPWGGITRFQSAANPFSTILAGPLVGISTTYVQSIALTMFNAYINNKSMRQAFHEGLKFPITFFTNAIKTGKKYSSSLLERQTADNVPANTTLSLATKILLFLRMGRIVGESIYGLLPYHDPSPIPMSTGGGDGEKIWKMLLGSQAPTFTGNLSYITLGIITTPYLIGAIQALYDKIQKQPLDKTELYQM